MSSSEAGAGGEQPGRQATQAEIAGWFDATYRRRGLRYLRPVAAYPIYLQLLGAQAGEELLDVACGPGLLLRAAVARGLRACGIDISATAVALARRDVPGAAVVTGNVEDLPYAAGRFHHVTCIGALERFLDRRRALAEMARVLRPDGRLCCMVRNSATLSWRVWQRLLRRQNHAGHQDAGSLGQWRSLFASAGFQVDAVHPDQWLRQRLRQLWGRGRRDLVAPEPVAQPLLPLRYANEFIFLLRKHVPGTHAP